MDRKGRVARRPAPDCFYEVIARRGPTLPGLIKEARRQGDGWVYIIDQRTRNPQLHTPPEDIIGADVDVLAPCALGGIFTHDSVDRVRAQVIAGAANNQLADDTVADLLAAGGVLWAPDFVANAGGIINIAVALEPSGSVSSCQACSAICLRSTTAGARRISSSRIRYSVAVRLRSRPAA